MRDYKFIKMARFTNPLKAIGCSIKGHDMEISHVVNERVNELSCKNCGKQITNNIYGEIVPLNDRYLSINKSLSQLARKKRLRATRAA